MLGSPVSHSLSPVLHRAAHAVLGLDGWRYDAVEVAEDGLAALLGGLDDSWRGLSLTMPLKRTAMRLGPLLGEVDEVARRAGGANTLVRRPGESTWSASNTDVGGARAALVEAGVADAEGADGVRTAVVLGGGATAASVLLALADLGCRHAVVAVRAPERAETTMRTIAQHPAAPEVEVVHLAELGTRLRDDADLLVSTVPAAVQDDSLLAMLGEPGPGAAATTARVPSVFDVVYDPWPTPLAARAAAVGARLVSGLDLLVHQAVLQVAAMTAPEQAAGTLGVAPGTSVAEAVLPAVRAAGEHALSDRASD